MTATTTDPVHVEQRDSGRFAVTVGLTTVWVSEDEARTASTDPEAAARLLARLT